MANYTGITIYTQAPDRSGSNLSLGIRRPSSLVPLSRPQWLPEEQWPCPTPHTNQEGHTIAVSDVGEAPVLVLVHTKRWSFISRDIILGLSSTFRRTAIDAPRTGQNERLLSELTTIDRSDRAVAAVIERLALQTFAFAIDDLGRLAGIAGAILFAERVRGIAALNTFGRRPDHSGLRFMLRLMGSGFMLTQLLPRATSSLIGVGRYLDKPSGSVLGAGIDDDGLCAFHYYIRIHVTLCTVASRKRSKAHSKGSRF